MSIESSYAHGEISNSLKNIDDISILQIIRLSCASNDLATNHYSIKMFPNGENGYFFYNSISIAREIAKLIKELSGSKLSEVFSDNTAIQFHELETSLVPFHEKSLSKAVLKPIRDTNFHYNFPNSNQDTSVRELLSELKNMEKLNVGVKPEEGDLRSIRYTFADWFRNEYINSHLNSDLVSSIATISVGIVAFLDTLMADLHNNHG